MVKNKDYFDFVNDDYNDIRSINKCIKEIDKIVDDYQSYEKLKLIKYDDLCEILKQGEEISNRIRRALANKDTSHLALIDVQNKGKEYQKAVVTTEEKLLAEEEKRDMSIKDMPVSIKYNKHDLLTIHTPLTFKRGYKKSKFFANYSLAYNLKTAIQIWQDNNNFDLQNAIKPPYHLVMKRVDKEYIRQRIFDADNIENQRIVNVFSVALNLPDGANVMSYHSVFEEENNEEKWGTFFYVFSQKDFEKYKYLLKTKTSKSMETAIKNNKYWQDKNSSQN